MMDPGVVAEKKDMVITGALRLITASLDYLFSVRSGLCWGNFIS